MHASHLWLLLQDSSKIDGITKDCADSTNQIPRLEEDIPKLQNLLLKEEKVLEEIKENSKGAVLYDQCYAYGGGDVSCFVLLFTLVNE